MRRANQLVWFAITPEQDTWNGLWQVTRPFPGLQSDQLPRLAPRAAGPRGSLLPGNDEHPKDDTQCRTPTVASQSCW